jgi:RHS repeat-associated protein
MMIFLCSALFPLLPVVALGQVPNLSDVTSTPIPGAGHSYIQMLNETVNPANGSVSVRLGLPVPPGRKLTVPFNIAYDSSGHHFLDNSIPGTVIWKESSSGGGGWTYTVPWMSVATQDATLQDGSNTVCRAAVNYMFNAPDGSRHPLNLSIYGRRSGKNGAGNCDNATEPDGSPIMLETTGGDGPIQAATTQIPSTSTFFLEPVTVADADGTSYSFPYEILIPFIRVVATSVEDRNGNLVTISTDPTTGDPTYTDTLGRPVLTVTSPSGTEDSIAVPGLSPFLVYWGSPSYSFNVNTTLVSPISCTMAGAGGVDRSVSSIVLPNGQSYSFQYDPTYSLLTQITYPSGGYVSYTWGTNSQSEFGEWNGPLQPNGLITGMCDYVYDSLVITDRYVSYDGSTIAQHQHFSYYTAWESGYTTPGNPNFGQWQYKQTTVATTDNVIGKSFQTVYTYAPLYVTPQPNTNTAISNQTSVESTVQYNDWNGNPLKTETKAWWDPNLLTCELDTLDGSPLSGTYYVYGLGDQMTDKKEFDYGQITSTNQCSQSQQTPPSGVMPTRETVISYHSFLATPIFPAGPSIFDRPASVKVYGNGSQAAQTTYYYDGATPTGTSGLTGHDYTNYSSSYNVRGNATSMSKWVNTSGGSLTWNYAYDDTGQALSMTDPKGNSTGYSYADAFPACGPPQGSTNAYLTQITDAKGFNQTFTYRYCDGQLNSAKDRNNQTTSYSYADSLNRLTQIAYPDGGQTGYSYTSTCPQPAATTILIQTGLNYTQTASFDGICRVTETAITSDPAGSDYTDTTYDGMGHVRTVSNPYRSKSDPTYGTTTTTYDALGRVSDESGTKSIVYPDTSATSTSYSAIGDTDCSTVTDPAPITRTLCSDALGRLSSVNEAGSYSTSYIHDALDDLVTVTQSGQTRSFGYDSLARLTSASNPESGTTHYCYSTTSPCNTPDPGTTLCSGDPSSVCTRTDARSITTTYAYNDPLNRLTGKSYNDIPQTPTVSFAYDESTVALGSWTSPSLAYPNGRLTHTTTSGSTLLTATVQDYDPMGRPKDYWQCTPLNCGSSSIWAALYNYDFAGDVTSWNHPANFTIYQTPIDGARHVTQVTSSYSDTTTHPATLAFGSGSNNSILYTAWGAVSQLQNGCVPSGSCTPSQETYFYNNRLQMAVAELGNNGTHAADYCREYSYYVGSVPSACSEQSSNWPTGSNNNGNVGGYYHLDNANNGALSHTATYQYDSVNRLSSAVATGNVGYNQTYTIDAYGNMTCAATPAEPQCLATTYLTNHSNQINYITSNGVNLYYQYDSAGNLINDGTHSYQWDAEARLVSVDGTAGQPCPSPMTWTACNTYNALGQRVRDVTLTTTTDEAYGAGGNLLWRYTGNSSTNRSFVPFMGSILAEYYSGGTLFDHPDELGSITASTSYDGSACQERLFYPFGESWTGANLNNCNMHQTFAQLPDYDAETDQYNTPNRHYTPSGRWLSPDPGGLKAVSLDNPQSWNMYAYALNNPTTLTDPSGEKANITTTCTTNFGRKACTITISATIAIYAADKSIKTSQLQAYAGQIKSGIEKAWNGEFFHSGVDVTVNANVTVTVKDSKDAAMKSDADNVIGLTEGEANADKGADSFTNPHSLGSSKDTGVWSVDMGGGLQAQSAHEFGHLLGVGESFSRWDLMDSAMTKQLENITSPQDFVHATYRDFDRVLGSYATQNGTRTVTAPSQLHTNFNIWSGYRIP